MKVSFTNIVWIVTVSVLLLGGGILFFVQKDEAYSASERRTLAQKPTLSKETLFSGTYMADFEEYALDQFPFREMLRSVKAYTERYVFFKKDSNEMYYADGHLSKIEYPMNEVMMDNAAAHFEKIYDSYLKEQGITPLLVMVPDKNAFLAQKNGVLAMEYDLFWRKMEEKTPFMEHLDIRNLLEQSDYYNTDAHWRQECIRDVADAIAVRLGVTLEMEYEERVLEEPFYGVYVGQAALAVKPDSLHYMWNDLFDQCVVKNMDTGKAVTIGVYDWNKADSKDPYEVFLSGASALITIENPNATTEKELVVFRDSFGSSITPYFIEAYQKITLIDIRYMQSEMVGEMVAFENQDVIFIYSTLLLNRSTGMK
jgi:hypothetical protein